MPYIVSCLARGSAVNFAFESLAPYDYSEQASSCEQITCLLAKGKIITRLVEWTERVGKEQIEWGWVHLCLTIYWLPPSLLIFHRHICQLLSYSTFGFVGCHIWQQWKNTISSDSSGYSIWMRRRRAHSHYFCSFLIYFQSFVNHPSI